MHREFIYIIHLLPFTGPPYPFIHVASMAYLIKTTAVKHKEDGGRRLITGPLSQATLRGE